MRKNLTAFAVLAAVTVAAPPAVADTAIDLAMDNGPRSASRGGELPAYVQNVVYARQQSGIELFGDAYTWWGQAAQRYERGRTPRPGAVLALRQHDNLRLGHVASVSRVVDSRTVLLRHANWSPVDGRRGQIENDVRAIDVSPANDWSAVRVWYGPINDLGATVWPAHGFIYPAKSAARRPIPQPVPQPARATPLTPVAVQSPMPRQTQTASAASRQTAPRQVTQLQPVTAVRPAPAVARPSSQAVTAGSQPAVARPAARPSGQPQMARRDVIGDIIRANR